MRDETTAAMQTRNLRPESEGISCSELDYFFRGFCEPGGNEREKR